MKRVKKWLIHAIAYCQECGWNDDDYETCQRNAREHANKTGHRVTVETGYAQHYNSKINKK